MKQPPSEEAWRVRIVGSRLPWGNKPDRPADIGEALCTAMLARENILEDANYQKITPNQFVIEIGLENYARNFQLLEEQIIRQWNEKLLGYLLTANSRQGRQEYRFAGPVKIEIHPVADLENQVRIYCRVKASGSLVQITRACLELVLGGRRFVLRPGIMILGRDAACDIYLDSPEIQQKRLVSSQHAYLSCKDGSVHLFDGVPNGKPSLNGTYVNLRRLPLGGVKLKDGDLILLAAIDPSHPDPNSPGVAYLRFHEDCR